MSMDVCVVCRVQLLPGEPSYSILHQVTHHTCTPLKDVVGPALQQKLNTSDVICVKCLELFNKKDELQKMTADMNSHIMTKIKGSSIRPIENQATAISIVVGDTFGSENIKEELERQYKNIQVKDFVPKPPLTIKQEFKENPTVSPAVVPKKRRGRPPKVRRVSKEEIEESQELPPLMVNQRKKRKCSSKFSTFLEVLKGEKEFYIDDEGVEEPKSKKRGGGRKKRTPCTAPTGDQAKEDCLENVCVIQVTDIDVQEQEDNGINRDRLDLDEVVQEIFGMTTEAETSLIQDIEIMENKGDLINVIHKMKEESSENIIDFKKINNMTNIKFEMKDHSNISECNIKTEVDPNFIFANTCTPSIEVTEIEEDMAASVPSLELTITQSANDTICAEIIQINDPEILNAIVKENKMDILADKVKQEREDESVIPKQKKYRCKLCSEVFLHIADARRHTKELHAESQQASYTENGVDKPYRCSECERTFPTVRGRDRHHLHMHLKHKPVSCPECHIAFNSFRPLERHLRNHHDHDPTLYCEMCEAEFVLGTSLEHHKEIMHPVSSKKKLVKSSVGTKIKDQNKQNKIFACPFCNEEIMGAKALKRHHRKKHNGKEYICKYCKYKSICLSTMHRHMVRVHKALDLKLYNCMKCMANYRDPADLEEHYVSVHNLEAAFHCQYCGEKFACIDMLRFHRSSHRAFSCKLCHLGFMKEEALDDHIKVIHTHDPVGCAENDKSLNQGQPEGIRQVEEYKEKLTESKGLTASSKVLVITSDGAVQVNEELKEMSAISSVSSEDITLHLQQTQEGGLEEMDMLNPLKGHKVKDLPKKMSCPICNKVLTTKFLRTHMLSHKGNLPHKCHICDKAYAQGTLLRKHMKNRHYQEFLKMGNKNPKKHKVACDFCQEVCDTIYLLEEHLWQHINDKTFECKDCKIKFGMESNLREHYKSHFFKEAQPCPVCRREFKSIGFFNEHVEKCQQRWKCEHCGLECDSPDYYRKHQRSKHGGERVLRHQCTQCEKSFVERHRYEDHIITHSTEKAFSCPICHKQFKRQRPLNDHMMKAHSDGMFGCSYCRKAFPTQQELDTHTQKHRKEFPCTSCNHVYASSEALINHMIVHHSEASHICHICSQTFHKQASLKAHLVTHSSNTPNICFVDGCHIMFRSEGLLRNHMARRHHELHYECSVCDRKFALESDQLRHMTTHLGETPLPCDECGKSFQSETLLEKHRLTHSQEKPYECGVCQHTATLCHQLERHIQAEHGFSDATPHLLVNRWQCSECGKMFVVRGSLLRHLQEHTNQGTKAEGLAVKTRSTPTSALELSVPTGMVDPAHATTSFLEQMSALSWQDLTPLLHLHVISSEENGQEGHSTDIWQCPGCHDVTQTEDDMRDHLEGSTPCQEAVILQLACGFANTNELEDEHSSYEQVLNDKESGAVLQLAGIDGDMQYVIMHEENSSPQRLADTSKETQSDQDGNEDMQVLVSMEDGLQHLLTQPTHPNIQIIVEDSTPLKQLFGEGVSEEGHSSAELPREESRASAQPLNGSEVLLQTSDGHLVLQQTVGGVTQFQLVEGVATTEQSEDASPTPILTPHTDFILQD